MLGRVVQKPEPILYERVVAVGLLLLSCSIVFGGPLGIVGRGERHLLLAVVVVCSLIQLKREGLASALQFVTAHPIVLAPGLFAAINLLWVFRAVFHDSSPTLALAVQDAQSLLVTVVCTLAFVTFRERTYRSFDWLRWIVIMVAVLAGIQTSIWVFLLAHPVPQEVIESAEAMIFGTNEGVNILRQWNAGVWYTRIVWISSYWFVPCIFLAPLVIRKSSALLVVQTLMAIAVIVSFTRGIWLALIVAAVVLLVSVILPRRGVWRGRLVLSRAVMISVLAILLAGALTNFANFLVGEPGSMFARLNGAAAGFSLAEEGMGARLEQSRRLLEMWQERVWFGHGYGAYIPDLVRHEERPFIYEMVPVALLMKLGLVGFGLYCGFLAFVSYRIWSLSACSGAALALLPAMVGYLFQIHTNPVFFSFTGMFIFSVLLSLWLSLEVNKAAGMPHVRS